MSEKIKVVACIVTYNSPLEKLSLAINSFLNTSISRKLIIVDNNSPDINPKDLEKSVEAQFIQSGKNGGFGFGHNIGINIAPDSEYYLVLNPDVIIHEETLEKMISYLDNNPDVGLLSPKIFNEDGTVQYLNKRRPTIFDLFARRFLPGPVKKWPFIQKRMEYYIMKDYGYDIEYEVPYVSGCFMLFRRSILEKIGGFDENYFLHMEDADISVRANQVSKVKYFPQASITHFWTRDSHHSLKSTIITIKSAIYFFKKWGWKWI